MKMLWLLGPVFGGIIILGLIVLGRRGNKDEEVRQTSAYESKTREEKALGQLSDDAWDRSTLDIFLD